MIPAGPFLEQLFYDLDATSDEAKKTVLRRLNIAYFDIARETSWQEMRRTTSLTFTGSPILLPSDLLGIDAVWNDNNGVYTARDRQFIGDPNDNAYRWEYSSITSEPLATLEGVSVKPGETTVNGLDDDYTGEYIVFAGRHGFYKITDANGTISPAFQEEAVNQGAATIRPAGTKYLQLFNPDGTVNKETVNVDYYAFPQPIHKDGVIHLPQTDYLALEAIIRHIGLTNMDEKKADRYRREHEEADAECHSLNPIYVSPANPRNRSPTENWSGYAAQIQ